MDNMNRVLNELIIQETVRGGQANFRPAKRAPNLLLARLHDERKQERAEMRRRVVCVKLPGLFAIIRLPRWLPLGTLLD